MMFIPKKKKYTSNSNKLINKVFIWDSDQVGKTQEIAGKDNCAMWHVRKPRDNQLTILEMACA
jgi:hypothetical protein